MVNANDVIFFESSKNPIKNHVQHFTLIPSGDSEVTVGYTIRYWMPRVLWLYGFWVGFWVRRRMIDKLKGLQTLISTTT